MMRNDLPDDARPNVTFGRTEYHCDCASYEQEVPELCPRHRERIRRRQASWDGSWIVPEWQRKS